MAKDFATYMAESGQQSTLDQLRKDFKYDEAKAQYERTGSYGAGSSSSSGNFQSTNFQDIVNQSLKLAQEANKPAVASLQASIPEISQKFATERANIESKIEPLKERYANLLDEVTSRGQASVNKQTTITSNELGKRGIVGSSTLAQQEIQNATEPIQAGIRTATKDIGLAQEEGIAGLTQLSSSLVGQETEQTRAVKNAIAQLQAGGSQQAINNALQVLQANQAEVARQQLLAQQQSEADFARKIYETIQLPESQANLANIQSQIANRGSESGGLSVTDLLGLFGGGQTMAKTGYANVDKLIAQGRYDEARALLLNP